MSNESKALPATKQEMVLSALSETLGNITEACKSAGISRSEFYRFMQVDQFAERVTEIREEKLDFAENSLFTQIQEGNTVATIFYLKCHGKHRGYIDKPMPQEDSRMNLPNYTPE